MDNVKSVKAVRDYCIKAHASIGQKYGDKPYSYHLLCVATHVEKWIHLLEFPDQRELAIKGAWAHDLLEDVKSISYNDSIEHIGGDVAEVSFLMETPKGRNRSERHCDAYYQGMAESEVVVLIKIADRLANIIASQDSFLLEPTRKGLLARYVSERKHFEKFMRPAWSKLEPMWLMLDSAYEDSELMLANQKKTEYKSSRNRPRLLPDIDSEALIISLRSCINFLKENRFKKDNFADYNRMCGLVEGYLFAFGVFQNGDTIKSISQETNHKIFGIKFNTHESYSESLCRIGDEFLLKYPPIHPPKKTE